MKKWLHEWGRSLKSFNRNIRLFILSNVLIQIGMGVFSVMYNLYIRELGLPESVNGSVISMTSLATALMLIPAGLLSDKIGRKWLLIIGSTLTAILLVGRSVVIAEQPMLMLAFGMGIVWALAQVSGVPFLAENSSPREQCNCSVFISHL